MGEGDSTTPVRSLEVSISFGRFENDLLSWEKWSSFSQNKYLEEVEKCATPGSVAEKKAYFEARNKLIAVRKAEMLNKQMEVCQESKEENEIQNTCVSEVDQYDEEVIEENLFGSELSSPGMNEQLELESNVFMSQEPDEKDVIEAISTNQLTTGETILMSETSCPLVVDYKKKDSTLSASEPEMLKKDNTDDKTHGSNSEFDMYDGQSSTGRAQEKQILKIELSGCETDLPFNKQSFVLGSAQTDGEKQVGNPAGIGSKFDVYNDAPEDIKEEFILKSELSPNMLDQLKVDDSGPSKCSSPIEDEHVKSKVTEDTRALKIEKINVGLACDARLPNMSAADNAPTQKVKPRLQNSSKKIFPANKQNGAENVKKLLVSSVPGSPQMSTPKISKPSIPAVKSASRSVPVSSVKKKAASAPAVRKSPQVPNATRSTMHSTVSSLKPSLLSPSKKGADLLTSRKKIISPGVSQKLTHKSLHMSLNFGSKVSGSISGATPVTEPRKSLFLEKMGDKDIVKRAFRAFQYMSTPLNIDINATSKKVEGDKTDVKLSTPLLQKEKGRLVKKSEVDVKSKKSESVYTSDKLTHSKEEKRKEVNKVAEKTKQQSKYKEYRETCAGDRRQSLTYEAATQPGLHKRQGLSKSFQDKDASKSGTRQ